MSAYPSGVPDLPIRASADDRCPGAVRLHEAADGFVGRVRIPGGRVSPAQVVALADLAEALGDGFLYLTSRGNVQLRGLGSSCGQELADGLYAAGLLPSLTHDRVRNVVASPLSGVGDVADIEAVLRELDASLLDDEGLVALSGRFLFGIDAGDGSVLALAPDVAVVLEPAAHSSAAAGERARVEHAVATPTVCARLAIAGELTAATAPVDLAPDLLIGAAHRFLALRAEHAPTAWRAAELPAAALAELSPGRPGPSLETSRPPLLARDDRRNAHLARVNGVYSSRLGAYDGAVVAGVPLGSAPADAWRAIAGLFPAERADDTSALRLTPQRSVVLVDAADEAGQVLDRHGFLLDDADPLAQVTACIGRPGCAKALADVRADAAALAQQHPGVRLHLSGCDRRCGHPTGPHLSAVADPTAPDGYTLEQH